MSTHGGDSFPGPNSLFGRVHRVSRSLVPSSRWFRSFVPSFRSLVPSSRSLVPYLQIHHNVISQLMIHQSTAEFIGYLMILRTCCCILEQVRHVDGKSKNLSFNNYFVKVIFSKTIAYIVFKFCLGILQTHIEEKSSQIFHLGPSFYLMTKIGKHFTNFRKNIFHKI